jgi:hypothetical protein
MKKILLIFILSHSYTYGFYSLVRKISQPSIANFRLLSTKTSAYDPVYTALMLTAMASIPYSLGKIIYSRLKEDDDSSSKCKLDAEDCRIIRLVSIANS